MTKPTPSEFFLFRYVPDVVKGEYVNIGIVVRKVGDTFVSLARFTQDWSRVQAVDPDADIVLLEAIGDDIAERVRTEPVDTVLEEFLSSLSNSIQIDGPHASFALTSEAELDRLMLLYVEAPASSNDPETN